MSKRIGGRAGGKIDGAGRAKVASGIDDRGLRIKDKGKAARV
jgi:hypothetical protein